MAIVQYFGGGNDEIFIALDDTDDFKTFWRANQAGLEEIGGYARCLALACNCELLLGGGRGAVDLGRVCGLTG